MAQPIRLPNAQEQNVLDHLVVRPVTEEERPRWNELVSTHHYLKNAALVGEQLCYVAEYQGQWLALLGWSAAARHLRPRDAWIGWSKEQLPCRRHLLANNARFCILADPHQLPNLATRALALCCARLSDDWLAHWEHPIIAVESFVDGQLFRGTAYKAAGWTRLDDTSGYARVAEDFYERHERPKQLWVRALDAKAFRLLCGQTLPPTLAGFEKPPPLNANVGSCLHSAWYRWWTNCPTTCPTPVAAKDAGISGARSWPSSFWPSSAECKWANAKLPSSPASSPTHSAAPCAAAAIRTIAVITTCLRKALFSGRWRRWTQSDSKPCCFNGRTSNWRRIPIRSSP